MTINRRQLLGAGMGFRTIDPTRDIQRAADEDHGVLSPRILSSRQADQDRFTAESDRTQRVLVFETMELHKPSVPANTTSQMSHLVASSSTTMVLSTQSPDVGMQCRVVAVRLQGTQNVTAGIVQLQLTVFEDGVATDYVFDECQLNTSNPRTKSLVIDWMQAPQLAKGATWSLFTRADASFLPAATINVKALITFGYEQWV